MFSEHGKPGYHNYPGDRFIPCRQEYFSLAGTDRFQHTQDDHIKINVSKRRARGNSNTSSNISETESQ